LYKGILKVIEVADENGGPDKPLSDEDVAKILEEHEDLADVLIGEDVSAEELQAFVDRHERARGK
jgi:hypothetical protein